MRAILTATFVVLLAACGGGGPARHDDDAALRRLEAERDLERQCRWAAQDHRYDPDCPGSGPPPGQRRQPGGLPVPTVPAPPEAKLPSPDSD
jgi:hypothetical protein